MELSSAVDLLVALLALAGALFLAYGAWLVLTRDQPLPAEDEVRPAAHNGNEMPHH